MDSSVAPRQLVLALDHAESFAREDFLAGPSNAAALALIERWPDWPDRIMALVGPEGSGKSHLASIWARGCRRARAVGANCLRDGDLPAAFATGALVLEDSSSTASTSARCFICINLAREEGAYRAHHRALRRRRAFRSASAISPRACARCRCVALAAPDDALLRALIVKLAADRQLSVDEALVNYLANRIERSFAAARAAVARLDEEAMRQHRPVTRALAAELFRERRKY